MNYSILKLPIYFILFKKTWEISSVHYGLKRSGELTHDVDHKLMGFVGMYALVFLLLLCS